MKPITKPVAIAVTALSLLVILVISITSKKTSASTILNPGAALYAELSVMAVQDAKERYRQLTPEQRREVWRIKLSAIDVNDLLPEQIEFLKNVIKSLDELKFDGQDNREKTKSFYEKAKALFSPNQAYKYFGTLGNPLAIHKVAFNAPRCECAESEDFCAVGTGSEIIHCVVGALDCRSGINGCGWLWTGYCDGMCGI